MRFYDRIRKYVDDIGSTPESRAAARNAWRAENLLPEDDDVFGIGIDEGAPFKGTRYGGADTIHNTGSINIVLKDGAVDQVWFRCLPLAFTVSGDHPIDDYASTPGYGARLVAVEFVNEGPV